MAKKLGCTLEPATPLLIKVAHGQRMINTQRAKGFTWVSKDMCSPTLSGCCLWMDAIYFGRRLVEI